MRIITTLLTFTSVIAALSACAYVIPEDPNMPRNNIVVGPMRKPELNSARPQSALPSQTPMARNDTYVPPVQSAEVTPVQSNDVAPSVVASAAPASGDSNGRHTPIENAAFQVSSSDYPAINSVPPRPATSGPDATSTRLQAVQAGLEVDRTRTLDSKAALSRDAAAEPSLLAPMPEPKAAVVPANDPVSVTTTVPDTTMPVINAVPETKKTITVAPTSSSVVTTPVAAMAPATISPVTTAPASSAVVFAANPVTPQPTITTGSTSVISTTPSLPAIPVFAPPAPMNGMATAPSIRKAPIVASAPAPSAAQPITVAALPAPAAPTAALAPIAYDPEHPPETFTAATPTVKRGDFNPLAPADTSSVATTATAAATAGVPTVKSGDFNPMAAPAPAKTITTASLAQSASAPTIKHGDFDPLATAAAAPAAADSASTGTGYAYASTGYIGQSRYADRRY